MFKTITSVGAIAALAATATAHGTVTGVTIDGKTIGGFKLDYYYAGQNGGEIPEHIGWYAENLDNGFVEPNAFGTADIICHKAGSPKGSSDTLAKVAAGGTIDFHWSTWPKSHIGPVITYVAPYTGDIEAVKKEELKWSKIEAAGYENGEWAAVKMIGQNNTWPVTVPENLAAGKYVFRHEIIALHGAGEKNGAQAYPQCLNIEVSGAGTDAPTGGVVGTELYTAEEDGIIFNPYGQDLKYTIPGPALWTGAGGSGSGSTPTTPSTPSSAPVPSGNSTTPVTSPSSTPSPVVQDEQPTAESPVPSAAGPSTVPSAAPSSGAGSGSDLPETFTLDSFIAWLEEKAGVSGGNQRRHARQFRANRRAIRGYY